jgi:hypothetical protein
MLDFRRALRCCCFFTLSAQMRRHKGGNGLYVVDSSLKPHVMAYMQRKTEEAQRKNTTPSFDASDCVESLPPHYQRQKQGPLTKTVHASTYNCPIFVYTC